MSDVPVRRTALDKLLHIEANVPAVTHASLLGAKVQRMPRCSLARVMQTKHVKFESNIRPPPLYVKFRRDILECICMRMTAGINKGKLDPRLIMIQDATTTLPESNDWSPLYRDVFPLLMEHMYGHLKGKGHLELDDFLKDASNGGTWESFRLLLQHPFLFGVEVRASYPVMGMILIWMIDDWRMKYNSDMAHTDSFDEKHVSGLHAWFKKVIDNMKKKYPQNPSYAATPSGLLEFVSNFYTHHKEDRSPSEKTASLGQMKTLVSTHFKRILLNVNAFLHNYNLNVDFSGSIMNQEVHKGQIPLN